VPDGSSTHPEPGADSPEPLAGSPSTVPNSEPHAETGHGGHGRAGLAALTLAALGVVFGDIGTSPLYALHTVFAAGGGAVHPDQAGVYGIISLVFWSITAVVSLKYVTAIMRVNNGGEGGIMALIALVQRMDLSGRLAKATLVALGIFGAALFYGDGMITPAISVLSSVEGLEVVAPSLDHLVLPITLAVLTLLFSIQRHGTGAVGRLFGPIMGLWFSVLALAGAWEVATRPGILRALSPTYALEFFVSEPGVAFLALASVVLVITGAEALYADMGHFGRAPISRAWFFFVFPALTLNYLGQGALILGSPSAIDNPFFLLFPSWSRIPMVILATAATVIASQAVISGAFSVTRQAVQLGFLPRMRIRHTSEHEVGQVYVPAINWGIFVAVVVLVVGFRSSAALASAYGIAVTGTLAIDTILFCVVLRVLMKKPMRLVVALGAAFLVVDLAFFSASLTKVFDGGWFPLLLAGVFFLVLMTWQRGRRIVTENRTAKEGSLRDFVRELYVTAPPVHRVAGCGVFLHPTMETAPLAFRQNFEHNHVLHEYVLILSIETLRVPRVPESERLAVDDLGFTDDNITHFTARFGFQDDPDVPATLRLIARQGESTGLDVDNATYFLSHITIARTDAPGMQAWRKRLFITLSRNAASPVEYFALPAERTVIMGSQVEL
jgi:KUP system potassium uptake protein